MLEKLRDSPNNKVLLLITLISLFFFVLIAIIMQPVEQSLMNMSGYGVLDFEFAWSAEKILIIFNAWGSNGRQMEAIAVSWDFAFIPSYGFFIFGAIVLASRHLEGKIGEIGIFIAFTPLIAGIFDIIENINLLLMLGGDSFVYFGSPFIASLCATIKFSLLLIGIIFFFLALLLILINHMKK